MWGYIFAGLIGAIGGYHLYHLKDCFKTGDKTDDIIIRQCEDFLREKAKEINKEYDFSGTQEAFRHNKKIWGKHFPFINIKSVGNVIYTVLEMQLYRAHIKNIKYLEEHPGEYKDCPPTVYTDMGLYQMSD